MCKHPRNVPHRAIVAAALGVLLWAGAGSVAAAELAGELVSASGPVEVRPLGEAVWRAATLKAVLHPGDMVRTGQGGAAEVAFVHGVFRMDENTVIILPPPQAVPAAAGTPSGTRLLLYRGRALFQILKDRLQGGFDVITPSVIVGVKGTIFGVEQAATPGVIVFDGNVQVFLTGRPDAPPVAVDAGQFTQLVQGQLTPPRPYQPAPGAIWGGAPTGTENAPLLAPSSGPPQAPMGPGVTPGGAAGLAAPALAQIEGPPAVAAPALFGVDPPRLASVGGPPGSSDAFATTNLTSSASGQDSGDHGSRGQGKGRNIGCIKGKGRKPGC